MNIRQTVWTKNEPRNIKYPRNTASKKKLNFDLKNVIAKTGPISISFV